jgi:RHS repeat-associated protein
MDTPTIADGPADQVTDVAYATGRTVSYAYDATGNRTSVVEDADGTGSGMTTPYTANALNQYTAIDGFVPPLYDSNGNLTRVQTSATTPIWTYAYDAQNRLVSGSATDGTTFTFAYDAKNRCIARTINATTTLYIFDGWNLIDERNAADTQQAKYIHGPAIDEMLVRTTPTGPAYYHQDGLGSTTALTNATGTLLESYRYDVFGAPTFLDATGTAVPSSPTSNRFQYTGREYLAELSLYDYRNRAYSAEVGRFLQTDPIHFDARDVNLYRYVRNNPANDIDPLGLESYFVPPQYAQDPDFRQGVNDGAGLGIPCGNRIKEQVWDEYGIGKPKHNPTDVSAREAHCIAHCRITRECPFGARLSWLGGFGKEVLDQLKKWGGGGGDGYDSGDMAANAKGRQCAKKKGSCEEECKGVR